MHMGTEDADSKKLICCCTELENTSICTVTVKRRGTGQQLIIIAHGVLDKAVVVEAPEHRALVALHAHGVAAEQAVQ